MIPTFTNRKGWLIVKLESMIFLHPFGQFQKDFNYIARYLYINLTSMQIQLYCTLFIYDCNKHANIIILRIIYISTQQACKYKYIACYLHIIKTGMQI